MSQLPCPALACRPNVACHLDADGRLERRHQVFHTFRRCGATLTAGLLASPWAQGQGFDQINTTVLNVQAILILISVAVVTIAIIWAGFKMIFGGARLSEVANVLIGGTLVGGAAAFASFIVTPV